MRFPSLKLGIFAVLLYAVPACAEQDQTQDIETYKEDYPGCVAIVKNQLALFPVADQAAIMTHLMNACMSGREIGEKRTKKMYDIGNEKKPSKQSDFKIQVVPPSGLKQDSFDVQY